MASLDLGFSIALRDPRGAPSLEAMLDWLYGPAVVAADGGVMSWSNPAHPGYRSPEAAGFLLTLLAVEGAGKEVLRQRIVEGLLRDVTPAGGLGRGQREYVFDTAVVLSGLLANERAGGRLLDASLPGRMFRFMAGCLAARRATGQPEGAEPERWSLSYGCHLLKVVRALYAYHDREADPQCLALIEALLEDLLPLHTGGRFRIHANSRESYTHAHCYAVEGLLCLIGRGWTGLVPAVRQSAAWLAELQEDGGGVRAGHDGNRPAGRCHADATAQALRIWLCVDRRSYAGQIARALGFLRQLQGPGGGLRYHPESGDVNTWATVFGVQAVQWVSRGADPALLT